ncbi:MAG: hypothetical protein K6T63_02395 [Alicyclobacillus herbarius]|uniref:hypothetical protein n=1 Tax=Alicyclobacillus herbarius TaxID=122960 RepID=UPI00042648FD|nr:hypothetical protein [Alicyclobacillus herbarius]MCL6631457.1 hypothetical protein [Alicyclobacillus herbarius]
MAVTYHVARRYLGQWVNCHSVYGIHRGVLTRVLPSGIVLGRAVQLASDSTAFHEPRLLSSSSDTLRNLNEDVQLVQFFGGFFVPFGGIYGLYPGFGFGFVI